MTFLKVNGLTIRLMVLENTRMLMVQFTKETGKMINKRDKAKNLGMINLFFKGPTVLE